MTGKLDYVLLGKRIKHYRTKAHLTQEALAEKIDAATSTIAHAERGSSKPSLPLLIKIANALEITLDQLICDSLPAAGSYLEKDIADLLYDCSPEEKRIIRDIIAVTKTTLRKNNLPPRQ